MGYYTSGIPWPQPIPVSTRVDQNNGLGLYYNGNERAIVAWITNDTPDKRGQ